MTEQEEARGEGHQLNIGGMEGNVEQVGDRIDTGGGAFVDGGLNVGGNFVGRDQYTEIVINLDSLKDAPPAIVALLKGTVETQEDLWQPFETAEWEPVTELVPAGPFVMGAAAGEGIPSAETPASTIALPAYRIGRAPVTNSQYARFVKETGRPAPPELGWLAGNRPLPEQGDKPVAGVSWYDALAYCLWLARETGRPYTLPNEAQWEKAARGDEGRLFPWGKDWEEGRCNDDSETVSAVDSYPEGKSVYGCLDMVGNVREWTLSLWGEKRRAPEARFAYPWVRDDGRNELSANSQIRRVTRGGAALPLAREHVVLRASRRGSELPLKQGLTHARIGFRVVLNLEG